MRISEGVQTCALPISRVPVLLALPSISVACSRRPLASTRAWSTVATSRGPSTAGLNRECRSDCGWLQTLDCCAAVLPWGESSWTVMDGLAGGYVTVCVRRSEEHTSELQSLMRISYAVFCLKKKNIQITIVSLTHHRKVNTHQARKNI